jgi:hypothetical protein
MRSGLQMAGFEFFEMPPRPKRAPKIVRGAKPSQPRLLAKLVSRSSHAKRLRGRAFAYFRQVVTQFQLDRPRTDSPVRILHGQPASPVSTPRNANSDRNRGIEASPAGLVSLCPRDLRASGWTRLRRTMNGGIVAIDLGVDRKASRKGQCPTKS